ncbi:hypothetical protein [Paenibacillus xylanexedens]|uniref:hypothetical protein n=1 Tax=Paenibacillus xylanexedens TaxID=528191 RepID=UPI0011A2E630|nr:hypothetical protein [Paenibacillus xylanexedens]
MRKNKVGSIVDKYANLLKVAREKEQYNEISKLYHEYTQEISNINDCEIELMKYLEHNLDTLQWDNENLWFIAIYEHPSPNYIPYFINILKCSLPKNVVYYRVLDILSYMPDDMSQLALPQLYLFIDEINPNWSEEVIEKYFEAVIMINDSEPMNFLRKAVNSPNPNFSFYADYWINRMNEN